MKKNLFVLMLAVLLLLTACAAPGETTQPPAASGVLGEPEEGYPYSNMQQNFPSGNYMRYQDQILFYEDSRLYSYHMDSGEVTFFCTDATCPHVEGTCKSGTLDGNLLSHGGHVYGVYSRPAGMGFVEEMVELRDGVFQPNDIKGSVNHFFFSGDDLYVVSRDGSLIRYTKGTGTGEILLDEYLGNCEAIFGDYLYYTDLVHTYRMDLCTGNPQPEVLLEDVSHKTDGHHIYYTKKATLFCTAVTWTEKTRNSC